MRDDRPDKGAPTRNLHTAPYLDPILISVQMERNKQPQTRTQSLDEGPKDIAAL